ncbi:MAG: hypothetical protein AB1656_10645 [Candidatus Omnitrophota bacterium]
MPKDKRLVESSLLKKGFCQDNAHHKFFYYQTMGGNLTHIHTYTSHGSKMNSLDDYLLNQMAKQCRLKNKQFLDLVDCSMDREGYEKILREKNLIDPLE